ncbi:hypothetical protein Tco_0985469, partial [Tanacetum coccineum]
AAERVRDAIGFEYCLASSSGWTKSPVLWVKIGETSLTGLELLQEMTGKVTPWKSVVHFGKKGKLVPRYVGPFEILERIGLKCLADANMHVPLDEIKVDKTLRFVEEPVETMDREIKKLKRRKIVPVKVGWNSKCGPEYEPKVTTSAPKKGTTYVGYTSQSTPMLKTTGNSSKKDNISMSNSFSALNEEEDDEEEDMENVYDESANLIQNTKAGGSSSFMVAVG